MKKYRPYPSKETIVEHENILEQDFFTNSKNEKWVADTTYIHTLKDGWCYLASVLDLHTKNVVGYSFSCSMSMSTELVIKALDNAYTTQSPNPDIVLHIDLGSQYTSDEFTQYVLSNEMKQSFSRKGCLMIMH